MQCGKNFACMLLGLIELQVFHFVLVSLCFIGWCKFSFPFVEKPGQIELPAILLTEEQEKVTSKPPPITRAGTITSEINTDRRTSRRLLGELCVDKNYLEQLVQNPGKTWYGLYVYCVIHVLGICLFCLPTT